MVQIPKIGIIGGGFSGLTVAHHLSKDKKPYEIILFEKNNFLGGQAASIDDIEYSWRVFFPFYKHLFKIIEDLKINPFENIQSISTPYKNKEFIFKEIKNQKLTDVGRYFDLSYFQILKLKFLYALPKCILNLFFSNISFIDYLGENKFLIMLAGPVLGQEAMKISTAAFIRATKDIIKNMDKEFQTEIWKVTSGPPLESIFIPWENYLINNGVTIKKGTQINKINKIGSQWRIVDQNKKLYKFDKLVIACSLTSSIKLLKNMQIEPSSTLKNLYKLTNCLQYYLSINLYFSEEIAEYHSYIFIDLPWQPIIEVKKTEKWKDLIKEKYNDEIKEVWNVGVLDYIPGSLHNKILRDCNLDEIVQEILYQLENYTYIKKQIYNKTQKTFGELLVNTKIFPYWTNNNNKIHNTQPKFSLNAKCEKYLISNVQKDLPDGIYFSSVYCKTRCNGVSMERACEAGYNCYSELINK